MRTRPGFFPFIAVLCSFVIFQLSGVPTRAQDTPVKHIAVKLTDADKIEAGHADAGFLKAWAGNKIKKPAKSKLVAHDSRAASPAVAQDAGDGENNQIRFPGDLAFHNGHVVETAESHAIYLLPNGKCPISKCWGDPERFLRDIGKSEFIHVTDQYVGQHASNRYTLGDSASLSYTPPSDPFTDDDMLAVVHAVAAVTGQTGRHHIYHVLLPPGQDECLDATFQVCASNAFCAYHSSATFQDIGHVLYTVEPFADVLGCQVRPGSPNGSLIDSTDSIISHELIETITDPDGTGWWNSSDIVLYGEEIADECVFFIPPAFSDPAIIIANGHRYALQQEYSNHDHGCIAVK